MAESGKIICDDSNQMEDFLLIADWLPKLI